MIRVLLLDDHPVLAEGMRELLSAERELEVVAVAQTGERALELARSAAPEVGLLDIDLPGEDGLATGARLIAELPALRLVYFSVYANPVFVLRALAIGAKGYLLKEEPAHAVANAIRSVAAGGHGFSEPIRKIAAAMGCVPRRDADPLLSEREREVVLRMARGQTLGALAGELGIVRGTARVLWSRAQQKLGLRSLGAGLFTASLKESK